jgi:hypothetical protein
MFIKRLLQREDRLCAVVRSAREAAASANESASSSRAQHVNQREKRKMKSEPKWCNEKCGKRPPIPVLSVSF